jgi:hypothetical protein
MAIQGPSRRPKLPMGLGPFSYDFRPSPAGPFGTILIYAPEGAPPPACGDLLTLSTSDCSDADFEVMKVSRECRGWRADCEPRSRSLWPWRI